MRAHTHTHTHTHTCAYNFSCQQCIFSQFCCLTKHVIYTHVIYTALVSRMQTFNSATPAFMLVTFWHHQYHLRSIEINVSVVLEMIVFPQNLHDRLVCRFYSKYILKLRQEIYGHGIACFCKRLQTSISPLAAYTATDCIVQFHFSDSLFCLLYNTFDCTGNTFRAQHHCFYLSGNCSTQVIHGTVRNEVSIKNLVDILFLVFLQKSQTNILSMLCLTIQRRC